MRLTIQALLVAVAVLVGAEAAPAQQRAVPKLVLNQQSWDFGEVWHEVNPQMDLVIMNQGNADLKLTEVRTSCGCTLVKPERNVIPPGESTKVRVTFNTSGKQDKVTSKVIIDSNDPARPRVEFPIEGKVRQPVRRVPQGGIGIRALEGKPGLTATMRLENQMSQPMKPRIVSNTVDVVDLQLRELRPGLEYEVVAKTNRPLEPGQYRGMFVVETGLERDPRISLGVTVHIVKSVEASPAAIYIRPGETKGRGRIINLHYYGTGEFEVTRHEVHSPHISVQRTGTLPPQGWMKNRMDPPINAYVRIDAQIPSWDKIPEGGTTIDFYTNDPDVPKIVILVTTDKVAFNKYMKGGK